MIDGTVPSSPCRSRTRVRLTMEKNRKYTVWLTDQGGRAFMGKPDQPESRWRVYGEYVGSEPGVGLWMHVEYVEQTTAMGEPRLFAVSPPVCLVPWTYVITIQLQGEKFEGVKVTDYKH
jgi:hypothetical protein